MKTPWTIYDYKISLNGTPTLITDVYDAERNVIFREMGEEWNKKLKHIAACVKACAGINPEAVPKMIKALEKFVSGKVPMDANDAIFDAITLARKGVGG